ncbi:MAG: ABC transporter substrate-binding protein [Chloroflexota bacterium]|nr:ABC transporter substrate-binding protein [Chloroflexota bacterium]
MKALASFAILIVLTLCTACTDEPTVPPTPTAPPPTPSPTPEPQILTVCLPDEPDSLYLYGTNSLAAQHVWQAIYDGPFDSRSYVYQPVILTSRPDLAGSSAAVKTVPVQAGDRVLTASGEVIELTPGTMVEDANGQRVTFDGALVLMQQMVVTFTLHPDIYWSDGMLLTADDSVFSFEIAADPATPTDKYAVEHTAAYQATDVRTVVWSGVPGFLDHAYFLNFWHPLPRHAWGHLTAAELLSADIATRQPLGWGPFVLREWVPGDHITAVRNPIYFRTLEGLGRVDQVTFRFISDPTILADELLTGRCDVVTHEAADAVRAALPPSSPSQEGGENGIEILSTDDTRWEFLAFDISPAPAHGRPDFFEDVRVRQAIALCIDRQVIAEQVLGASGRVSHSTLPPEHPLYAGDALTTWGYAPVAGQTLLATAGWYDTDGDGTREAHSIPGIADGTPFQVNYQTTDDPLRVQVSQLVQAYLSKCGIQVNVETQPPEDLFAPGPEGVLFGRRFDLAQFSWRATSVPLCDLFLSSQIPDAGHWGSPNVVGFLDDEYDTACLSALEALPGSAEYATGHIEAQRIFSERLPALPLFQRPKVTLALPSVIGLAPDPAQASELWNIEQLGLRP